VWVTVGAEGRDVVVDVADDGPGIAPDVLATMFDHLAEGSADRGVGLALVSEVAASHGGWISVVHTGRRGVTLRLRLPAARPPG
jgi:signal transduction histidine kinase